MQVECNINWMQDMPYISSAKHLGIMFKQCQSMQFNQQSTLPFLEHAGELRIIVLRKRETLTKHHTPKRKLKITFAPRKENDMIAT
jgi:predicted transglutaminase-like cysteine proteinase